MQSAELNVVTGAFGYTGKYITRRLVAMGKKVITLTGHPGGENPFGNQVLVATYNFDNPEELAKSLRGATTFYNTYWVRFEHGSTTYAKAIENTNKLIYAAKQAGIRRFVHISITYASETSSLPYFRGKGLIEEAIRASGLSYAIIRPTVIFGYEDVLINNIAWLLRRLPVFAIPGEGDYKLQPVFVEDVAEIAVDSGQRPENIVLDAAGPEIYRFNELIQLLGDRVGGRAKVIHLRPKLALFLSKAVGYAVRDVMLTQDELAGLMANLLVSEFPPTGKTRLSEWLRENAHRVGIGYTSELDRHYTLRSEP